MVPSHTSDATGRLKLSDPNTWPTCVIVKTYLLPSMGNQADIELRLYSIQAQLLDSGVVIAVEALAVQQSTHMS